MTLIVSFAQAETLRLVCAYSHTLDNKGRSSPTNGEDLFTIDFDKSGKAQIEKTGLGAKFEGVISEDEIVGETASEIQGSTYTQHLVINRYTGNLTITLSINSKGGLTHLGNCRTLREKRF